MPTLQSKEIMTREEKAVEKKAELREERAAATTPTKQKTVLLPGSPPELAYAPPQGQQYYEARTGVPFHNAIGTETKKTVRMDESTENTRRIVTVEQTSRVIKFGDSQKTTDFQQVFDQPSSAPKKPQYQVPTPKKFVQGQFRESDYESDADTGRIKPKWAPADSDTEEPRYRKVQPPAMRAPRSSSVPVRQEHVVSPMEFDSGPPVTKRQTSLSQTRDESRMKKFETDMKTRKEFGMKKDEESLKPGSPPEFGYISRTDVKQAANRKNYDHVFSSVLLCRQ